MADKKEGKYFLKERVFRLIFFLLISDDAKPNPFGGQKNPIFGSGASNPFGTKPPGQGGNLFGTPNPPASG